MYKIVLFASGSGTNVDNIIKFFNNKPVKVGKIYTNNPNSYVIKRAKMHNIPIFVFSREALKNGSLLNDLQAENPDLIVLAGFLWLIPPDIVKAFPRRIINIHPALLPKYGGKGMYGDNVHKAVAENKEKTSGITIHYVNEKYDEGDVIFQEKCEILPTDNVSDIAEKVHSLEYKHYPKVIEKLLNTLS